MALAQKQIFGFNPFVGPHPIETGRKIFGRDREIDDLYYLLSAERIVMLHSPSGAGKSSLIQAGLIPRLTERFDVWGPTRVNLQPPANQLAAANRYVRSAVLGFEQQIPAEHRRNEEQLARMTLAGYVANRPRRRSAPQNIVLIFDQFEEILTADPLAIEAKREFFHQLGELLLDPRIWALFALREDYLPALDPYAEQVPTHLKNWFRLDLLRRDAAREAIVKTSAEGGRQFAEDKSGQPVVDKLVRDLATMKVQQPDGTFIEQIGLYVEPLQLQVVCRRLWEQMPNDKQTIDPTDIEQSGDVTDALSGYYADEVARIANGNVRVERAIREWMGDRLVTPDGIRKQVLRGVGKSEGLDNDLIAKLVNTHLVRGEQRDGATWYELAHDRLLAPIQKNNEVWWKNQVPLLRAAQRWKKSDKDKRYLFLGEQLQTILKEQELTVNDHTIESFIEACKVAEEEYKQEEKNKRRQARLISGLAILLGMISLPSLLFIPFLIKDIKANAPNAQVVTIFMPSVLLVGGFPGWLLLRLYRRRNGITQALQKLRRKFRIDRSLQGAVDLSDGATRPKQVRKEKEVFLHSTETLSPFDAWETQTLQFAPLWVFLAVAGAKGRLKRKEAKAVIFGLRHRTLRFNRRFGPVFRSLYQDREKLVERFTDDPRDTIRGLEDVARILRTRASSEESLIFRQEMLKIGRNVVNASSRVLRLFSKTSAGAKNALLQIEEILGAKDLR